MKQNKNILKWIFWVVIAFIILLLYSNLSTKTQRLEDYDDCIDSCSSNFRNCLEDNTLSNLAQNRINEFEGALPCLWDFESCVHSCRVFKKK